MSINGYANYSYGLNINLEALERAILKIQEKIYLAAKTYAMNRVYKYQNIFFTQKEFVFAIIEKIFLLLSKKCNLLKGYSKKLMLVMYFTIARTRKTQSYILGFVKSKIVEYYILLLMKPEWEARYERSLCTKQNSSYIRMVSHFAAVFFEQLNCPSDFSSIKIKTQVNWKNLRNSASMRKVICGSYLSNRLNLWPEDYNDTFEKMHLGNLFRDSISYNELHDFFNTILYTGLEWHLYVNLKFRFFYRYLCLANQVNHLYCTSATKSINRAIRYIADFSCKVNMNLIFFKCSIYKYVSSFIYLNGLDLIDKNIGSVFRPSRESIKQVFCSIRRKLYCKNYQGYRRINNYISPSKALLFISKALHQWQADHWCILAKTDMLLVQKIADRMFYIWQIKK